MGKGEKNDGKKDGTIRPFDPMTLRGVTMRNRIWLPPMDTYSALAQDGRPTPFHYQHYVSRAVGGFGMIRAIWDCGMTRRWKPGVGSSPM